MTEKNPASSSVDLPPTRFWLWALAGFCLLLWLLKPMLLPFVVALALAYFLNPPVDALARHNIPRWVGAILILVGFVALAALLLALIVPLVQGQIGALAIALPDYAATIRHQMTALAERWMAHLSAQDVARLRDTAGQLAGSAAGWGGKLLQDLLSESAALFDIVTLAIITPVVTFYLLRDWPRFTSSIDVNLPRKHRGPIREILGEINAALSGFLRGQALVCLCLGVIYSVGLSLAGLNYGATIGIIAGILSFVPYVGSSFMLVSSLTLGFIQFDRLADIGWVVLVFAIGQSLEGYVLTPKLVGDRVGLHPVWILFALFAGGSLLGFVGVLIAVPMAAVIGVLARFGLKRYRTSRFYRHA